MNRRKRKKLTRHLFEALWPGDTARLRAVLRAGAGPEWRDSDGMTPLYSAAVSGRTKIVRVLLVAGAAPDTESRGLGSEGTPLCAAACWGHTETVRALLEHGADPNLREEDGTGRAPLDWALDMHHAQTADLLVAAGAVPRART
ncbi:ankyrin repeat domain-containing protein [Streptomyces longispororuber]|nr:ankyrin repeat domain-containing protein [Streptomyces longispororuber]